MNSDDSNGTTGDDVGDTGEIGVDDVGDTGEIGANTGMEFFFDADSISLVHDIVYDPVPPFYFDNLLDFSDVYLPKFTVNCDHHSSYDITLDASPSHGASLSPRGLVAASMVSVDLVYSSTSSFPVIFNTGASLAIIFDK